MSTPMAFVWPMSAPVVEGLGWVLVHSLWQFALVAILASVAVRVLRRRSAAARYGVLIVAMAMLVAAPAATCLIQLDNATDPSASRGASALGQESIASIPLGNDMPPLASDSGSSLPAPERTASSVALKSLPALAITQPASTLTERVTTALRPWLAWMVACWCLGVAVCSLRPLLGWYTLRRLRRVGVSPASDEALAALQRVSDRLGLRLAVQLLQSSLAQVPVVVGYLRPVILLPASLVTCTPTSQLEAILAHELAHVRRHDFLINLLQTLVETVFFYHPAVWWLSRQVRVEREHCCDDFVVQLLGNRVEYGRALVAVEQMRGPSTVLALGAADGALLSRVRRILGVSAERNSAFLVGRWPAALLGVACLGMVAMSMNWSRAAKDEGDAKNPPGADTFGPESGGLRCRLVAVPPTADDESPDLTKSANVFTHGDDATFAVELQNVSQKAITLLGVRYGESTPAVKGKLNTAFFGPHLFEFDFTDAHGKPVPRTARALDEAAIIVSGASAHEIAPGKSLVVLLRPAKFHAPMDYRLLPGSFRAKVRYRGPSDKTLAVINKHWPDKPQGKAWSKEVESNELAFTVAADPTPPKPLKLVWGPAKDGLQAAIELRVPKGVAGTPTEPPGVPLKTRLGVVFHVKNLSDKLITFASEAARQGDYVHVKNEAGEELELPDTWRSGEPIMVRWKLKPGEVAELPVLVPAINSIELPGKYTVSYTVHFNSMQSKDDNGNITFPLKDDWQSELETGTIPLILRDGPRQGLEFLAPYPKLHGLSLDMTEQQFLKIVKKEKLQPRKVVAGGGTQYHIATGDDHTVIVMFRNNEPTCTGIQRVRGEDPPDQAKAAAANPAFRIAGRVFDSETGEPIAKCRAIPAAADFDDPDRITWQSQYLKEFTDGRYAYETDRPWNKTRVRIEADGYRPAITRAVGREDEKSVEIDVKLERGVFAGVVLLPSGLPAAKAQLAVASNTCEVTVRSGKLSYGGHGIRLRKVVEADEQGRFEVPAEIDPSVLVAAHESGYAKLMTVPARDPRNNPAGKATPPAAPQANEALKITVRPWGRVEARVLAHDKPIAGASYWVNQSHADWVNVLGSQNVVTDADGRFVVERIPPGPYGQCLRYVKNKDGKGEHAIYGLLASFEIASGKTTTLQLGSPGRTLIGKLALPDGFPHKIDWTKVSVRISLRAPPLRFGDEMRQSVAAFLQTEEGKLYACDNVALAADGAFRIDGLPSAEYQLSVQATGQAVVADKKPDGQILRGYSTFTVPPLIAPAAAASVDLGTIKLASTVVTKVADANKQQPPPELTAEDVFARKVSLTAKAMRLKDALAAVARAAQVELQLDVVALKQAGLDVEQPVTVTIKDEPLADALGSLINWIKHDRVLRELRGGKLHLTTLEAFQADIERNLPDWLKVHYNHGLLARMDDERNVVSLTTGEILSDELLAQLKTLPKLRVLEVGPTKLITPTGLGHLAELPSLQKLSFHQVTHDGKGLGDAAIRSIVGLKSLRELHLNHCDTTDGGLRLLESMAQLTHLELYAEPRLTDAAIASIAKLKRLKHLSLNSYVGTEHGWMRFSENATQSLSGLQDLEQLHLVGQAIGAETLQFPRLKSLSLGGTSVDDACAARISACRQLQTLDLVYTNVSDDGLSKFADLPGLTRLNLDSHVITDAGIKHLRKLPKLQHVSLRASQLTDESLRHLAEIKTLTRVDLNGSGQPGVQLGNRFTLAGVQMLKALPQLRTLWLTNFESAAGFQGLKELTQLRELTLMMANIREDELDALEDALPNTRISSASGGGNYLRLPRKDRQRKVAPDLKGGPDEARKDLQQARAKASSLGEAIEVQHQDEVESAL